MRIKVRVSTRTFPRRYIRTHNKSMEIREQARSTSTPCGGVRSTSLAVFFIVFIVDSERVHEAANAPTRTGEKMALY